jgi:ornithine cyclodeaminase
MQIRILSAADVKAAVDMPEAIQAMRQAFISLSDGLARAPLRVALQTEGGVSLFMPASMPSRGAAGAKVVSVNPGNAELGLPAIHAVVLTVDPLTGRASALMDGTWLTALRTGAAGGLAADLLARSDASVVTIFGAGVQARTQLEAVRCVRDISEVRIVSPVRKESKAFASEVENLTARVVDDPAEALAGADIVVTATNSSVPVFDGSLVEPGTHVTGIGSYTLDMREVDTELVRRARVFVDEVEGAMAEAGDIVGPIRDGDVTEDVILAEIGEVARGAFPGRTSREDITFFKSVGNAVQDISVASRVLDVAEAENLGVVVDL